MRVNEHVREAAAIELPMNFPKAQAVPSLAKGAIVALGARSHRIAADRRRSRRIPASTWILDDPPRASVPGSGVPFLQRPILQALTWLERKWVQWKGRRL